MLNKKITIENVIQEQGVVKGYLGISGGDILEIELDYKDKYARVMYLSALKYVYNKNISEEMQSKIQEEYKSGRNHKEFYMKMGRAYTTGEVEFTDEGLGARASINIEGYVMELELFEEFSIQMTNKKAELGMYMYTEDIEQFKTEIRKNKYEYQRDGETSNRMAEIRDIKEGHVFDEDKTVRWNREQYKAVKKELEVIKKIETDKRIALREAYNRRVTRYIMSCIELTEIQANELHSKVSSEFPGGNCIEFLDNLEVIIEIIKNYGKGVY